MWVTTGLAPTPALLHQAMDAAVNLQGRYVERKDLSIQDLFQRYGMDRLLVFTRKGLFAYRNGVDKPAFFHPGLAPLRIKNLIRGDTDKMVEVAELIEGDSFLDCTLGWGADAVVASFVVGEKGKVVGIEANEVIAYMTKIGLSSWEDADPPVKEAMGRIEVVTGDHGDILKRLPTGSFDVVYFDPMFREPVANSPGLVALRPWANPSPLRRETIEEALRVCRRKVMMKERTGSDQFGKLGFTSLERTSATITFGVIEKS
ncbi:MAG: class I SAM-dependent methyltransferase [Thermicanus sp.]|nr:class I SAM-dependent methyltransferase [Thermicanus sp.]